MTETKMRLEDWLDDLCVRFIINLPENDLSSVERICFNIEEAQWYYEDFIRPLDSNFPSLTLRTFTERIFTHCPLLAPFAQGHMAAFDEFLVYKTRIPVRGAILMNGQMDAAVLVKGWKKGANWSFPRGKINFSEDDLTCAIREVYEETGYDIEAAGLVPEDRQVKYIEITMHDQQMRLYVFRDVPMDTHFEPRTRKEISKIQWWRLSDLPAYRKKGQQQQNGTTLSPNKFYMVAPFLPHLRKWVIEQKKQDTKRSTSNHYLSAGISHDEFLTEDDQGAESNTQGRPHPATSGQHIDTLEATNEALRALLKIQPASHGMQSGANTAVQSPISKNKGDALLAFLQGKPSTSSHPPSTTVLPHTPLEHAFTQAPQPVSPHYQHPRPPQSSTLPPPSAFPTQSPANYLSYQEPIQQNNGNFNIMPGFPQNQNQNLHQPSRPHGNPHSYQNQHLVHPQPLPPHVQRAVFTGGPAHTPMGPQPVQDLYHSSMNPTASYGPLNPQFPNLHAPMVPPIQAEPQPKLTSHTLALLNAFKSQDQANSNAANKDLQLRGYTEEPAQPPPLRPQELPAEVSRPAAVDPPSQFGPGQNVTSAQSPSLLAPKPISHEQRTALLGLFKSPTTQTALRAKENAATALPMTSTPSAVELSAVDTLSSNNVRASPTISHKKAIKKAAKDTKVPEMNPETNLPFRAMKILARPSQTSDSESPRGNASTLKTQPNGKISSSRGKAQPKFSPEIPFQPQILKRPESNTPKTTESSAISSPSTIPTLPILPPVNQQLKPTNEHAQKLQLLLGNPSSTASPLISQFDRRSTQPAGHREKLLSMFGASPPSLPVEETPSEDVLTPLFSIDPTLNSSAKTRMGSLTSGDPASRRSSQIAMSPADKGFLLSYLESVTKGV